MSNFNALPDDVKKLVLTKLENKDLRNTAMVSKEMNTLSKPFLVHPKKKLPADGYYYAVGSKIKISEPS
ncbi:F-box protein, partial [Legionella sp. PL877]